MPIQLVKMPPLLSITMEDKYRFYSKINRDGPSGCYLWTANRIYDSSIDGPRDTAYGQFTIKRQPYQAHRVAYFFHYKVDPWPNLVLHTCNTTLCVNPSHLEEGDGFDNMQYRRDCGRGPLGSCKSSKLWESDIPVIRQRLANGETPEMIAQSFNVTGGTIRFIDKGINWGHVP